MDSSCICRVQPICGAMLFTVRIVSEFDPVRQHCHVHRLPVRAPVQHKAALHAADEDLLYWFEPLPCQSHRLVGGRCM